MSHPKITDVSPNPLTIACDNYFSLGKLWNGKLITDKLLAIAAGLSYITLITPLVMKILQFASRQYDSYQTLDGRVKPISSDIQNASNQANQPSNQPFFVLNAPKIPGLQTRASQGTQANVDQTPPSVSSSVRNSPQPAISNSIQTMKIGGQVVRSYEGSKNPQGQPLGYGIAFIGHPGNNFTKYEGKFVPGQFIEGKKIYIDQGDLQVTDIGGFNAKGNLNGIGTRVTTDINGVKKGEIGFYVDGKLQDGRIIRVEGNANIYENRINGVVCSAFKITDGINGKLVNNLPPVQIQNGEGVKIDSKGNVIFGTFHNGHLTSDKALIRTEDGRTSYGSFINGNLNGKGYAEEKKTYTYEVIAKNGEITRKEVKEIIRYEGIFNNGNLVKGTITYPDRGQIYNGQFQWKKDSVGKESILSGKGVVMDYYKGTIQVGTISNGLLTEGQFQQFVIGEDGKPKLTGPATAAQAGWRQVEANKAQQLLPELLAKNKMTALDEGFSKFLKPYANNWTGGHTVAAMTHLLFHGKGLRVEFAFSSTSEEYTSAVCLPGAENATRYLHGPCLRPEHAYIAARRLVEINEERQKKNPKIPPMERMYIPIGLSDHGILACIEIIRADPNKINLTIIDPLGSASSYTEGTKVYINQIKLAFPGKEINPVYNQKQQQILPGDGNCGYYQIKNIEELEQQTNVQQYIANGSLSDGGVEVIRRYHNEHIMPLAKKRQQNGMPKVNS